MVKNNKAQSTAYVWMFALIMIFMIGLIYLSLSKPHEKLSDTIEPTLSGDYLNTFNHIKNYWYVWPIIFIPSVIIWMYVSSIKAEEPR